VKPAARFKIGDKVRLTRDLGSAPHFSLSAGTMFVIRAMSEIGGFRLRGRWVTPGYRYYSEGGHSFVEDELEMAK